MGFDNELYHYGVLGMKWGIRKGNYDKTFYKSVRKKERLDKRAAKARKRADTRQQMADRALLRQGRVNRWAKLTARAHKLTKKANTLDRKSAKWLMAMEKNFNTVPISAISEEHLNRGRRYAYMLNTGG